MAEQVDPVTSEAARRRISELTRQVGDEARVEQVTKEQWRERREQERRRLSATLLVGAAAAFIVGVALLTSGTYADDRVCGSALSNPGWPGGSDCHGAVIGYGWGGAAAVVISVGLALAARLVRWPDLD